MELARFAPSQEVTFSHYASLVRCGLLRVYAPCPIPGMHSARRRQCPFHNMVLVRRDAASDLRFRPRRMFTSDDDGEQKRCWC